MKTIISVFVLYFIFTSNLFSQSWEELDSLCRYYYENEEQKKAVEFGEKALLLAEKESGKQSIKYAKSLLVLGNIYYDLEEYTKSEEYIVKAMETSRKVSGENNATYAGALIALQKIFMDKGDFDKAEVLVLKAKEIIKTTKGLNSKEYAMILDDVGLFYKDVGKNEISEKYRIEALEKLKSIEGDSTKEYSTIENNLAVLYTDMGFYEKAELLLIHSIDIKKRTTGEKNSIYSSSLNNLAFIYQNMGQYSKAKSLFIEAISIEKQISGEKSYKYVMKLSNLGGHYVLSGEYQNAEPTLLKCINIYKELSMDNSIDFALCLNSIATLYQKIGQYEKAGSLYTKAISIIKEILTEKHYYYAILLNNLGIIYDNNREYSKADSLYLKSIELKKEHLGIESISYGDALNVYGDFLRDIRKYDEAKKSLNKAKKIYEKSNVVKTPNYIYCLGGLGRLYIETFEYANAEKCFLEALSICKEIIYEQNPQYAKMLESTGELYFLKGNNDKFKEYFRESNKNYSFQIRNYFPYLSENEKFSFVKKTENYFNKFYSLSLGDFNNDESVLSDVMEVRTETKGLILNATSNIKKRIMLSENEDLKEKYTKLINIREKIINSYSLSKDELKKRNIDIGELESTANLIEKDLSLKSEDYKFLSDQRNISSKDIRNSLKTGEAAIEFLSFRYYNGQWTDTNYYVALIMRPEYEYPKLVQLCREEEIERILNFSSESQESYVKNAEKNKNLYNLIWAPIEPFIRDCNGLFVSPSGLINRISLLSLMESENNLLCDKYSIHYLSNLKDIVLNRENGIRNSEFTVTIFGGVNYDLDSVIMQEFALNNLRGEDDEWNPPADMILIDAPVIRISKWNYLPGTLSELNSVKSVFEQKNVKVRDYSGNNATEEEFKNLSSKNSPTVLHVSTHGYFFPELKKEYKKSGAGIYKVSDNPLFRSGLILAGANRVWTGGGEIEGLENGILTAYEVSNMDLQNTELVVLSACETGLGDIKGGEGVYGLQRAFKVAGAKTIIMSLWKVPDKETVELMELFYAKWLGGMTKHDAFYSAQKEMRKKYPPYYWAAFVMVE